MIFPKLQPISTCRSLQLGMQYDLGFQNDRFRPAILPILLCGPPQSQLAAQNTPRTLLRDTPAQLTVGRFLSVRVVHDSRVKLVALFHVEHFLIARYDVLPDRFPQPNRLFCDHHQSIPELGHYRRPDLLDAARPTCVYQNV